MTIDFDMTSLSSTSPTRTTCIASTSSFTTEVRSVSVDCQTSDLLLHTGDFAHSGTPQELVDFGSWLGEQFFGKTKGDGEKLEIVNIGGKFKRGVYLV